MQGMNQWPYLAENQKTSFTSPNNPSNKNKYNLNQQIPGQNMKNDQNYQNCNMSQQSGLAIEKNVQHQNNLKDQYYQTDDEKNLNNQNNLNNNSNFQQRNKNSNQNQDEYKNFRELLFEKQEEKIVLNQQNNDLNQQIENLIQSIDQQIYSTFSIDSSIYDYNEINIRNIANEKYQKLNTQVNDLTNSNKITNSEKEAIFNEFQKFTGIINDYVSKKFEQLDKLKETIKEQKNNLQLSLQQQYIDSKQKISIKKLFDKFFQSQNTSVNSEQFSQWVQTFSSFDQIIKKHRRLLNECESLSKYIFENYKNIPLEQADKGIIYTDFLLEEAIQKITGQVFLIKKNIIVQREWQLEKILSNQQPLWRSKISRYNIEIQIEDLRNMYEKMEVSENIMNFYIQYLNEKYINTTPKQQRNCLILPLSFFQKPFTQKYTKEELSTVLQQLIEFQRRRTQLDAQIKPENRQSLFQAFSYIGFPVPIHKSWITVIINCSSGITISLIVPQGQNQAFEIIQSNLAELINLESDRKIQIQPSNLLQYNNSAIDSGIISLKYMNSLMKKSYDTEIQQINQQVKDMKGQSVAIGIMDFIIQIYYILLIIGNEKETPAINYYLTDLIEDEQRKYFQKLMYQKGRSQKFQN